MSASFDFGALLPELQTLIISFTDLVPNSPARDLYPGEELYSHIQ
jgi:hypothetical protein